MTDSKNLCMQCMKDIGQEQKCPYCGYSVKAVQNPPFLPLRTVLAQRFILGRAIGRNGEGIDYIGWDMQAQAPVYIRELFPDTFSMRSALDKCNLKIMSGFEESFEKSKLNFEKLWSRLASLRGKDNIIRVMAVFEDNGTAYSVYEHFTGMSLERYLSANPSGAVTWEEFSPIFMQLLSCLETLHLNGITHLGLSPKTIFITPDRKVKINGFCQSGVRHEKSNITPQLYPGYTAAEQYDFGNKSGSFSDVYALGAILYRALTGKAPTDSVQRAQSDSLCIPGRLAEGLPKNVLEALIGALQVYPEGRTYDIASFRLGLTGQVKKSISSRREEIAEKANIRQVYNDSNANQANDEEAKKPLNPKTVIIISAVAAVVIGIIIIAVLSLTVFKDEIKDSASQVEVTVATVTVPDFTGRNYVDIQSNTVFNQQLDITPKYISDDTVLKGYIISQSIDAESTVEKGTEIIVYVSQGAAQIELADVKGRLYDEVAQELEALGFKVLKTEVNEGGSKNGEILYMSPAGGHSYSSGTTVTLQVYVADETTTARYTVKTTARQKTTSAPTQAATQAAPSATAQSAVTTQQSTSSPVTEPASEAVTESSTEAVTEAVTQAVTQAVTEAQASQS